MKFSQQLLLASLASCAIAYPLQAGHQHHHHQKREAEAEVVVVTQYVQVNQYGQIVNQDSAASTPTTLSTILTSAADTVEAASTAVIVETSSELSASSAPVAVSSVASSASSVSSAVSSASSSDSSDYDGAASDGYKAKGVTYSPYTSDGQCKSGSVIESDISKLTGFDVIRVYAPDCSCVEHIMSAMADGQKIFPGLFYMDSLSSDIDLLATQVEGSSQGWSGVHSVAVGNEWVNSGTYSVSQVSAAVSSGRALLKNKGYTGLVVTVDTLVAYQNNPELCEISDYISVNSHPFWDGNVQPGNSGPWLKQQIENISNICNDGKNVLITETGWPHQGDTYGSCVPSRANQVSALKSIQDTIGDQAFFFTYEDDLWKTDTTGYNVEKYWGIFN
ncbi:hydrolase activity, acting on glycosyl bonds protein [[Candida] boidinii]|nr:hydrolase activity, acting on glycosyl bonds protein [[Candida] boidinii]OWB79528.1 hydrolase activity, acting on glycosyl bonds protein [[Candida] boidinii]